jgi:outer membrane protein, heavy metal efflux system
MYYRKLSIWMAAAAVVVASVGCAKVDPAPDFARAHRLIESSTGLSSQPGEIPTAMSRAVLADGLTLDEALRLALLNNRQLQAEFMTIGVAKADLSQAGLLSNPTLSLLFLLPTSGGQADIQAAIAQSISDLWQLPGRKRVARAELDQAVLRVSRSAGELVADTRDTYFDAIAARESVAVARESVVLSRRSLDSVRAQVQAGVASRVDENLAQGQALTAELALQRAERDAAVAVRRLASLLSVQEDLLDVPLVDTLPHPRLSDVDRERLVERARENRLDLKAAAAAARAAERRLAAERVKAIPSVQVGAGFERPEDKTASELLGPSFDLDIPVFDQNQAQVGKARYGYLRERNLYEDLFLRLAQEVRAASDRARASVGAATFVRDELLPQAESSVQLAQRAFELGDTTLLTLLEAQRTVLQARQSYIDARLEAAKAMSGLERAAGVPLNELENRTASWQVSGGSGAAMQSQ